MHSLSEQSEFGFTQLVGFDLLVKGEGFLLSLSTYFGSNLVLDPFIHGLILVELVFFNKLELSKSIHLFSDSVELRS